MPIGKPKRDSFPRPRRTLYDLGLVRIRLGRVMNPQVSATRRFRTPNREPSQVSRGQVGNQFGLLRWEKLHQHHPELGCLWQCLRIACRYLGADRGD